jgi:DNA processing protein
VKAPEHGREAHQVEPDSAAQRPREPLRPEEAWQMLALVSSLSPSDRRELLGERKDPVAAVRALARGQVQSCEPPWEVGEWRHRTAVAAMKVHGMGGRIISHGSPEYSSDLAEIADPPPVLYVRGEVPSAPGIAIVGSRDCTSYGRRFAFRLATELAHAGLTVISGLARGIDAAAHRGALEGGGPTVAVLPCGIERVYPARHYALARRIASQGALLTEFPLRTQVAPWNFPQRNRLIAGLARVTVVVEAAARSGARITARLAQQSGREVVAVPGPVTSPMSEGANALLGEGAHVCASWQDAIKHLHPELEAAARARHAATVSPSQPRAPRDLPASERACLAAIPVSGVCGSEELAARSGLAVPALLAALTSLEVRGLVRSIGGQRYERMQQEELQASPRRRDDRDKPR